MTHNKLIIVIFQAAFILMWVAIIMTFGIFAGCESSTEPADEKPAEAEFNCTGVWGSDATSPQMFIFMVQEGKAVKGHVFYNSGKKFLSSFDNGNIIEQNGERFLSFSFFETTTYNDLGNFAFAGKFYKEGDETVLIGNISGRIFLDPTTLILFGPEKSKFRKVNIDFLKKISQ